MTNSNDKQLTPAEQALAKTIMRKVTGEPLKQVVRNALHAAHDHIEDAAFSELAHMEHVVASKRLAAIVVGLMKNQTPEQRAEIRSLIADLSASESNHEATRLYFCIDIILAERTYAKILSGELTVPEPKKAPPIARQAAFSPTDPEEARSRLLRTKVGGRPVIKPAGT